MYQEFTVQSLNSFDQDGHLRTFTSPFCVRLSCSPTTRNQEISRFSQEGSRCAVTLPGGCGGVLRLLHGFFHHPETPQAVKLKLSDFKDTSLRHILKLIPGRYILSCYHGNKITKVSCRIWLNRTVKFLNNSVIFKDIELKFGGQTNFGPLN